MKDNTLVGVTNFWMRRRKEAKLLKIVSWAQYHGVKVEDLSEKQIREAIETIRLTNNQDDDT